MQKKPKKKVNKEKEWENQINKYKFRRVGIIKNAKFGRSIGTRFGAFGHIMDGPFGLQPEIIEETSGLPLAWKIPYDECEEFFDKFWEVVITYHTDLIGKPVLLLSNEEAVNYVENVIPHKKLLEVWKK